MCTGLFLGVKRPERGVNHPPHLALTLSKKQYYTSTPPLCLQWGTCTSISDQFVVSVLKCQQVIALKLTNNKYNSTEIHYWLLLSHRTMHVTKMITEYYKSANLSTDSAPLHWPEARIHKTTTDSSFECRSLSEHQQIIMDVIILVSSLSGQPLFFGTMCLVTMMFGPFSIKWDKRTVVGNELGWKGYHLFVSRLLFQLWCRLN